MGIAQAICDVEPSCSEVPDMCRAVKSIQRLKIFLAEELHSCQQ